MKKRLHSDRSRKISKTGQSKPKTFIADKPSELFEFLMEKMPEKSRNKIKDFLTRKQVSVNGTFISQYNHPLRAGQKVEIHTSVIKKIEQLDGLQIMYQDPDIIVINKEAGLLSIATEAEKFRTAYHQLLEYVQGKNSRDRIFIVHRLDRETSGVMVFAKSEEVKRVMQDGWKDMVQERTYLAIVEGVVEKKEGTISSWLKENKNRMMFSSSKPNDGVKAITHYKVLKSNEEYSLLEVRLETGRKNQIRVHMQDIGHSIVGDKKYGSKQNPIGRLGLHARVLAFQHPTTGENIRFETRIPNAFLRLFHKTQTTAK